MSGQSIKIVNANLDEDPQGRGIIVTGIIDPESLPHLQIDKYQREQLSDVKIGILMEAHRTSRVPTVELGLRGNESDIITRGDVFYLQKPTYIVDGYQRISAGILVQEVAPVAVPRISAVVHMNTSFEWERQRFRDLNLGQTKLSGNVNMRNLQWELDVVKTLVQLSANRTFILYNRISWDQSMKRHHLITGTSFTRTVGMLHSHIGSGRSTGTIELAKGLDKIMSNVGQRVFVQNIRTFYELIDKSWGIQNVAYRKAANQLKLTFMLALARMLSDHDNFWNDGRLVVDETTIKKLSSFPMGDPAVANMVSSGGGKSHEVLAIMLADHINHGRRTRRIKRRSYTEAMDELDLGLDEED